jgi:hypothetical protein
VREEPAIDRQPEWSPASVHPADTAGKRRHRAAVLANSARIRHPGCWRIDATSASTTAQSITMSMRHRPSATKARGLKRLAHSRPPGPARPRAHPEDQPGLALEGRVPRLLAAALRPARTRLTSTISPGDTRGGTARRGRSRCAPGHPGQHRATVSRKANRQQT